MSDTPTQAAALPDLPSTVFGLFYEQDPGADDEGYQEFIDAPGYTADQVRAYARQALAAQAQELDALRAALRWSDARTDGPPPCDGEAVFDGINSAGYPGAFNAYRDDGDCYMETAEGSVHVMGDLRYWRRHVGPATEGEANV